MLTCENCNVEYPLDAFNLVKGIREPYCHECIIESKNKPPMINVQRNCLKCDREFTTRSKIIRICSTCKGGDNWRLFST